MQLTSKKASRNLPATLVEFNTRDHGGGVGHVGVGSGGVVVTRAHVPILTEETSLKPLAT